jgi:hypothetical protein
VRRNSSTKPADQRTVLFGDAIVHSDLSGDDEPLLFGARNARSPAIADAMAAHRCNAADVALGLGALGTPGVLPARDAVDAAVGACV